MGCWGLLIGWVWGQYFTPNLLGRASTQATLSAEVFSANPAGAFSGQRWHAQAATAVYVPAPELNFRLAGGSFSWDSLQMVSLLVQQWQFDKLSQGEVGGGYGLQLLQRRVLIAVRGRLLTTNFAEYGRLHRFSPDIGFDVKLTPQVQVGGYGYNLLAQGWGFLPGAIRYGIGATYRPSALASVMVELSQEGTAPWQVHTAFSYRPHALLEIRAGVAWPMLTVGSGLLLRYRRIGVEMGYRYQPTTGSWGAMGLIFP